ncbi:hypothetical protein CERSUDRAFT_112803 [Gelatoporia subvermispora B]|uniref:Uncharacterized protein n=1 Tax=Ceriporiopsis subvermispora (strain B) TaxID=914234 RepID=M2RJX3_CERS8|nr:hypothetical protein CERSUDRAFT_112803 [Gelatoporia subvermispora B]
MTSLHSGILKRSKYLIVLSLALSASAQEGGWNDTNSPEHIAVGVIIAAVIFFVGVLVLRAMQHRRTNRTRNAAVTAPVALAYNARNTGGLPSYWASRAQPRVPVNTTDDYPPPPGTPPPPPPYPGKPAMEQQSSDQGENPFSATSNPFVYSQPGAAGAQAPFGGPNPWSENSQQVEMPTPQVVLPPAAHIQNSNAPSDNENPWDGGRPPPFSEDRAVSSSGT